MSSNMKVVFSLINFAFLLLSVNCYIRDPGPRVIATKGEVWPKPQTQSKHETYFVIRPQLFDFEVSSGKICTFLQDAFIRYQKIISSQYQTIINNLNNVHHRYHKKLWPIDDHFLGYLDTVNVVLKGKCNNDDLPSYGMDESYKLEIDSDNATLTAHTPWGILRGLETISQLIYLGEDYLSLRINKTHIHDFPRFQHRGLLVDTSRHFIPVIELLENLDAMAHNKMNVFHWHIVDDESFPYVSKAFPELSEKGAYTPSEVYTISDIKNVIEYARVRGIRVIPEFDSPGHTRSWGIAHRELLTECYNGTKKTGQLGPMDPTKNFTYQFLSELFQEIGNTFPDQYIHLGGDEVEFECWESNQQITNFMKKHNIDDYKSLESYYLQKLIDIVDQLQSQTVVWEEVFTNGIVLPNETIVQVWISPFSWTLLDVTSSGRKALLSACWYLDHIDNGGDWEKYYKCDPYDDFLGNQTQKELILGGEACMWAESVNEYNFISRVWPRASAVAERLWSNESVVDIDDAERRLEEHTCRLNRRGVRAQPPNGPGFCLK